jgi:hypothetical protein
MNTSVKDHPVFSGKIFMNSNIDMTGPLLNPTIKGNILLGNGTNITYRQIQDLNVKESQNTIIFAKLNGNQIVNDKKTIATKQTDLSGLPTIQATIEINPKSNFNVEVSKGFDLGVHISGGGMLNYSMNPNKLTSLAGSYEISKGTAELKFTGWPMKYFAITPGSTFRWDGSMEDPELNLEATSKVKGTYLNPIDNKNRNVDFIVSLKLADQFSKLKIQFGIKSPDSYIMSVLNSLSPDELMRQAVNLLLFEAIDLPQIQSSTSYMSATIAGFWESQLNSFTKSSFKKVDLSFGIDTRTQTSSTGAQEEKTNLTYSLERKMLKDRASVKVSGRLNEDNTAGAPTNNMIENFSFEYALDSLSTKFLKIYRKQDYQNILEGEIIKSGVGYLYHKNYVRLKDIWRRPDKKKNESVNQPANN